MESHTNDGNHEILCFCVSEALEKFYFVCCFVSIRAKTNAVFTITDIRHGHIVLVLESRRNEPPNQWKLKKRTDKIDVVVDTAKLYVRSHRFTNRFWCSNIDVWRKKVAEAERNNRARVESACDDDGSTECTMERGKRWLSIVQAAVVSMRTHTNDV